MGFCKLADRWKDCYGLIEDCRHLRFSRQEQFRFRILASSLLDEIRRRRPDLDVLSLATLSKLDFDNPPPDGELLLLVMDATDVIGEVYHAITTGRVGEYIQSANSRLWIARPKSPPPHPPRGPRTPPRPPRDARLIDPSARSSI